MQEKIQKISPIKQKILYFANTLNISKRSFYKKIGVSRGTLESNTGITEEILAKFIAIYPEISLDWLLTGVEPMLKNTKRAEETKNTVLHITNKEELQDKGVHNIQDELVNKICELSAENALLKKEIEDLKNNRDKVDVSISHCAVSERVESY